MIGKDKMQQPTKASSGLHSEVMALIKDAKSAGFDVDHDRESGVVHIVDPTTGGLVYWAISKGSKGPWIVRYSTNYFEA